ncbi:hypothetical protein J1N51_04545 [Psychrosphaera ytuae]|uniref:VWFA domain-containing protein n=1 Tax=Psychrosphaera ytuae TaxID=2820710 RepID=A0A975HJ12_9GAMM|nr:PilC/PilY family type IV pilus protein [Psychrosphaera ytuae]QTH64738.1 hypothetical protein J1N51_04545 [Psychrosphaera ytuae]
MVRHFFKRLSVLLLASAYCSFASFSAFGDDIEIYYGISDQTQVVNPNVIFILDTSGSMGWTDGETTSRMYRTKEALKIALNNISDVNISLMRFSDTGGRVLLPALDIDSDWDTYEVVRSIKGLTDFALQSSGNTIVTSRANIPLVNEDYNSHHALRFIDMDIPKEAIIQSAHITYFTNGGASTRDTTIRFIASTRNDPETFEEGQTFSRLMFNFLGLSTTTDRDCSNPSQAICWTPNGDGDLSWNPEGYPNNTNNLAPLIQTVIDNPFWQTGDPIVLFGQALSDDDDDYFAWSIGGADGSERKMAPQLRVRYTLPAGVEPTYKVRDKLISLVEEVVAEGGTPVVDSMFEAFSYINGERAPYAWFRGAGNRLATLSRLSHPDTLNSPTVINNGACDTERLTSTECRFRQYQSPESLTYQSPIDPEFGQCQANYIVLFSDGQPNATTLDDEIEDAIGRTCSGEGCAEVLADYMSEVPSERGDNLNFAQTFTYTVGFESSGFNDTYLRELAEAGGGQFYSGSTSAELAEAFTTILIEAKKGASTFVAPGISVNQFNRLTHSNDIYYALFDPRTKEYWPGNLKKYKLIDSVVLDNTSAPAIATDGFFRDDAHDWWSDSAALQGAFVERGGAASQQEVNRTVYSNLANSSTPIGNNDSRITEELLGITGEPDSTQLRRDLIDWMRGYDVQDLDNDGQTNDPRFQMADPLHSEPLFYQYGDKSSVYIGTNEGYLLSIDADTGEENWAFIPEDLLDNIHVYYENNNVFNSRTYGMDGAINAWSEDDRNYIVVGQRRGGSNYYVLDVTNRLNPIFKYSIKGGIGDFANLGQSWSKPTVTEIDINGTKSKVLIFGGGYDTNQDSNTVREQDSIGNSIFIVEAKTGAKLAEISGKSGATKVIPEMQNSIPSRIAVIDRNFDGTVDHMYFGDTGGHLFRVDIYNGKSKPNLFEGQRIYTTSEPNSEVKNRRFYYAPDVAEIVYKGEHYYAVSIGSGYRAHPLNEEIQDSVLMLKDHGVFTIDEGKYTFPEFTNIAQISPTTSSVTNINSYDGYEFNFVAGEKVITGVSIINSKLIFSTYDPSTAGLVENSCSAAQGGGRVYAMTLLDGQALLDNNNDGVIDYKDTYVELEKSGIPAEPRLIITDPDAPTLCIGTECADTIQSDDDANSFERLLGRITGPRSRLNQIFTNSWTSEVEPSTQDDN